MSKFQNMKKNSLALFITFHIISGINGSQCKSETKCELFKPLQPEEPSIFVINAAGRLGNHLMAFAIVMTLAKTLKIRPFVQKETAEYLSKYFIAENIPIYEDAFCNAEEVKSQLFNGDLNELVENTGLHKGKVLVLWPWGYQENSPVCCPADELMRYVHDHNMLEVRQSLQFQSKFQTHAKYVQENVAGQLNATLEEITFVGVHNRRTVRISNISSI